MRNQYPGICFQCQQKVPAGDGFFQRHNKGWRVHCATCPGREVNPERDKYLHAANERLFENRSKRKQTYNNMTDLGFDVKPTCQYCSNPVPQLVKGNVIYPHRPELHSKQFWLCRTCDAYAGYQPNSHHDSNKIQLADPELRRLKQKAHEAFDPLWKSGELTRNEAYRWLSIKMGIPQEDCHMAYFTTLQCHEVVVICQERTMGVPT